MGRRGAYGGNVDAACIGNCAQPRRPASAPPQYCHRPDSPGNFAHPGGKALASGSSSAAGFSRSPHHGGAGTLLLRFPPARHARIGARLAAFSAQFARRGGTPRLDLRITDANLASSLETRRYFFLYRWTWYEWLG